jgi:protease secretion system membrane fusion protein
VGDDRIVEERTGVPYFKLLAEATPEGKKLLGDNKVRPGMPVDLFVKTGERTMMSYLLKPLLDRMHSALREE